LNIDLADMRYFISKGLPSALIGIIPIVNQIFRLELLPLDFRYDCLFNRLLPGIYGLLLLDLPALFIMQEFLLSEPA